MGSHFSADCAQEKSSEIRLPVPGPATDFDLVANFLGALSPVARRN
jgi:hypothetical protein